MTVFYLPYMGLQPKVALHTATGGPHPLQESLLCGSNEPFVSEQVRQSLEPDPNQSWLHFPLISPGLTHHYCDQCCSCCCALGCTCAIIMCFQWHFGKFYTALSCGVPTAGFGFSSLDKGPLPRSTVGCTFGWVIPLCVLGIDEEPNKWTSYWGCTDIGNVQQGKDGRRWSLRVMCRTAHRGQGLWALRPWSRVTARASTHGCMAVVSASQIHYGISLTEMTELMTDKTSWKVASTFSAILACWFPCWVAILVCQSSY